MSKAERIADIDVSLKQALKDYEPDISFRFGDDYVELSILIRSGLTRAGATRRFKVAELESPLSIEVLTQDIADELKRVLQRGSKL